MLNRQLMVTPAALRSVSYTPVFAGAGSGDSSYAGRGRWPGIRSTGEVCHVETYDMVRTVSVLDAMMVV